MMNDIQMITADSFGSECPENWEEIANWMNSTLEEKYNSVYERWEPANDMYEALLEKWSADQKNETLWEQLKSAEKCVNDIECEWNGFQESFWENWCNGKFADAPVAED